MIVATAARLEPLTVARCSESASAAFAIPGLGTGNAFAVSFESGGKAFCSIMRTSTSWSRGLLHWSRRRFPANRISNSG